MAEGAVTAGVVGLGGIGGGVAKSCIAAGIPTGVCDLSAEALAPFAESAVLVTADVAALAAISDVLVVAVVDDAQVRAVLTAEGAALSSLRAGSVVVVVSTISPATIAEVAAAAEARGLRLVDCGVSGGPSAAATGELVCMVGGAEADIEAAQPVLDAMGSLVLRMGALGTGLLAKLARNAVQYGGWLAAYEGARLAEAGGIDLSKLTAAIKASDQRIGGVTTLVGLRNTTELFGPDDDAGFIAAMEAGASLAVKDLAAALEAARELGVELPGVEATAGDIRSIFGVAGA